MSKQVQDAYICTAIRTPVGKAPRGVFKLTRPDDLLAHCLKGLLIKNPEMDPAEISDVIVGCAMPEAEQGMNVARIALLLAKYPHAVPGMTINRFCSSGIQAVAMAADRIRMGEADLMVAAGTESMSLIPMMGHKVVMNPAIFKDENIGIAFGMGMTAEKVADKWKISREDQDAFAYESHRRAIEAIKKGEFNDEILPFTTTEALPGRIGEILTNNKVITTDEGPRADTTMEALAKLRPVFAARGSVTAGNSSQMSDGAGAVLLASERAIKKYHLQPIARFVSFAVAGVPPEIMGIGPKEALPKALKQAGLKQSNIDWIELNEAFAAQSLAVIRDLELDPKIVNPLGGAIALGHPLGATGAIRTATILHGMRRHKKKYGVVTMCIGTGMGAAGILEMV
ncbi:acetyl-CoA C-acyltransferase [Pigmentibacter sp. JX0631]|uniref:acetyl-CoA C-acyltransferase n=1 Tax=Pigmentibacter sp. JX0631 TaxID=2976982 RepID=UPI0024691239|nr:acetyl-CoA C-acyltransferase [Pigmentibacter sp. JX0631]WGL58855.1 acetyl-CoA C-acyltransferase [Pigmentibacter sp. JX0631]